MIFGSLDQVPDFEKNTYLVVADVVLQIIPHYTLMKAITGFSMANIQRSTFQSLCKALPDCSLDKICTVFPQYCDIGDIFKWKSPGIGQYLVVLAVCSLLWFTLLFLKEFHILKFRVPFKKRSDASYQPDIDVKREQDRVHGLTTGEIKHTNIVVKDVTKYYGSFLAVKKVNLAIDHSECFGLLGANGAGKTTFFKMMTGEVGISSGEAWIQGISLNKSINKVNKRTSYVPQYDALIDNLTGRETLKIFCLIRGVPSDQIAGITAYLAEQLQFTQHLDKPVKKFSGGNKRKLSTALALLTSPPVIFLDEPSAGLDPAAKRKLWNNVSRVREAGSSIVLTSHSMEECEALCTRLAIMVNGEFKCLGSTQHLKNRFSKGYLLTIKMSKDLDESAMEKIKNFVVSSFPGSILK